MSAIPAPQQPAARQPIAPGAGPAPADDLDGGADDKDLKGASSFGYGYYGYPSYYGGYGYGYPGYGYGYGRELTLPISAKRLAVTRFPFSLFQQVATHTTATEDCTEDTGTKTSLSPSSATPV